MYIVAGMIVVYVSFCLLSYLASRSTRNRRRTMAQNKRAIRLIGGAGYWMKMVKCQDACPVHTDACGYVNAIAEGRDQEATALPAPPIRSLPSADGSAARPARQIAGAAAR